MESATEHQGRILLVDDESAILRTFRYCLEDEGYSVATANSAAQAEALLQSARALASPPPPLTSHTTATFHDSVPATMAALTCPLWSRSVPLSCCSALESNRSTAPERALRART